MTMCHLYVANRTTDPETDHAEAIMILEMDMSTGNKVIELRAEYGEEVMMANWLPQPQALEPQPALQDAVDSHSARREAEPDVEAILRNFYLSQE